MVRNGCAKKYQSRQITYRDRYSRISTPNSSVWCIIWNGYSSISSVMLIIWACRWNTKYLFLHLGTFSDFQILCASSLQKIRTCRTTQSSICGHLWMAVPSRCPVLWTFSHCPKQLKYRIATHLTTQKERVLSHAANFEFDGCITK